MPPLRWACPINARDTEGQISYLDPSIEYHATFAAADGAVLHGHVGMRRWYRDREEASEELRTDPEANLDLGEQILMFAVFHARGDGAAAWRSRCRWLRSRGGVQDAWSTGRGTPIGKTHFGTWASQRMTWSRLIRDVDEL